MTAKDVRGIYEGSNGDATKELYTALDALGPIGQLGTNLFRAQKCSARAKVYRGGAPGQGSYRGMAYDRKNWSMRELAKILSEHAIALQLDWGWKRDPKAEYHVWVLYIDLPTGQVSFHAGGRGEGPDYARDWDGAKDASPDRIVAFCEQLLAGTLDPFYLRASTRAAKASPDVDDPTAERYCVTCCVYWTGRTRCPACLNALIARERPRPLPELRPGVAAEWDDAR